MTKTKAIVDFSGFTAADLAPVALNIVAKMTANAATFDAPPVEMADLVILNTTFTTRLAAKASRATADFIAFDVARNELESALSDLGHYVNSIAKGDAAIVEKSGFPSYETGQSGIPAGPPDAPTDLRLRHGNVSGEIVARYKPKRRVSINEVQKCVGDPGVEANWVHVGLFSGGKAVISGIVPGQVTWIRVRTAGTKGQMGAWSDPAEIRGL